MRRGGSAVVVGVLLLATGAAIWRSSDETNRSGLPPLSKVRLVKNVWSDSSGAYICPVTGLTLTSDPPQCGAPRGDRVRLTGIDVVAQLGGTTGNGRRFGVVQFTGTVAIDGNAIDVTKARVLPTGRPPGASFKLPRVVYADSDGAYIAPDGAPGPFDREKVVELTGFDVRPLLEPVPGTKGLASAELDLEGTVGPDGTTIVLTGARPTA